MPRRSTAPDAGSSVHVKDERVKVKDEKGKSRRKPAPVEESDEEEQPQEQVAEGDDEDAQGEEDGEGDDDDAEDGSPRGNKRRRMNGDGDSAASEPSGSQPLPKVKTLPRGDDGYIPGSIVRIQLKNFVTYDFVQFTPGPYLNMIVGPNGTGKSSIACAIALGLNFPPSILGRANELNLFVKNGSEAGYIEIELKGPKSKPNLIIRRNLKATSKSSTFTLNGVAATGNEIKNKMAELNVQVGNLCSFLPQDRVSEFAAMSPEKLLRETQLAAGDENLTKWHDTLIYAGKELRTLQQTIKAEEDSLKQMKDRNEGIEKDVKRFLERKKIEHDIALLDVLIPVAEYREIRVRFMEAKAAQRKLHDKVSRLKNKNEPAHALLKKLEQLYKNAEKDRDTLKKSTQEKFKKLSAKNKASDSLDKESNDIMETLQGLKKEEVARLKQINALEAEIVKLRAELEKPRPDDLPALEDVNALQRQINLEKSDLHSRIDEHNDLMKKCIDKKTYANKDLENAQRKLSLLDNVDNQRLDAIGRWDKDTHDAIVWVRENRHLFRMEVFETPFMRLTVKDKKYTNAVEACFGAGQMKSFIAQCQEDADVLNRSINDNRALGRNARITTWFRPYQPETIVPPPMSADEMKRLKFDGYAIDYVDCPEGMKYFLMKDLNLHRTAIALHGAAVDVNEAMRLVARPIDSHRHPGGANFINGSIMNIVNRSRYGKKAVGNMTRDVLNARNLTTPSVNAEARQKVDSDILEARQKVDLLEEERLELNEKLRQMQPEQKAFEARENEVKNVRAAIKAEETRKVSARTKLESKMSTVKGLKSKPPAEAERKKLQAKLLANNQKRMKYTTEYTDLVHSIIDEQQQCTRVGLNYLQIGANRAALQELCERKDAKYQTALTEYTQANELFQTIKTASKEILERSRETVLAAVDGVREEYDEIERVRLEYEKDVKEAAANGLPEPDKSRVDSRTVEELQAELANQHANLDLNMTTNPGVVEQYEKRKRDIEQLEKAITERKAKEEKIQRNIKNARDNWHPALQKLVTSIGEKFSSAFDRIGCAGEIRINENEDYEKWAIDILVKFRDSEKLQLLTAHRQSGGERSLTTILYLMSLTEEARAPFSLVDEINQGMDQRAERVVHNSMVSVTCKPDSAQYFLITPKLLPDLKYDERMRVLCVNNGEWLPEENLSGKMMDMIDGYVAAKKAKSRAAGEH